MSYFQWVFDGVCVVWVTSELWLQRMRRAPAGSERRDAGSFHAINITVYSAVGAGVFLGVKGIGQLPGASPALRWAGVVVIIAGVVLRWAAISTLNKFFTVDVAIQAGHRLVRHGLYRRVRHPSYSGAILSLSGLGLAFANWLTLLIVVVPFCAALLYRIRVEERALTAAFGDEYVAYCQKTKRLVPFVY